MEKPCVFCNSSLDDPLNFGIFGRARKLRAHYFCVLMSTSITQSGKNYEGILGFLYKDIRTVVDKCKNIKCSYCHKPGASVKCFSQYCKMTFHFPCGLKNDCSFMFHRKFDTYCHLHNHYPAIQQRVLSKLKQMQCVICFHNIDKTTKISSLLVTPCCKSHLMHLRCVKYLASLSKKYTRCPVCDDKTLFTNGLKHHGVYIPIEEEDQEVSDDGNLETSVDVRVARLYEQRSCNLGRCISPLGRNLNVPQSRWNLLQCNFCTVSAHVGCIPNNLNLCTRCSNSMDLTPSDKDYKTLEGLYNRLKLCKVEDVLFSASICLWVVYFLLAICSHALKQPKP